MQVSGLLVSKCNSLCGQYVILTYTKKVYLFCILNEKGEKFEAGYGVLTPELEELYHSLNQEPI